MWWHKKLHLLHNFFFSFFFFYKKVVVFCFAHLPAPETFLSVLWLCTSGCLAMSPWQPSLLLATHIVCVCVCVRAQSAVQLLPDTFTLSLHHKSVFECLCPVCSVSMSEEPLICGPLRSILSVFCFSRADQSCCSPSRFKSSMRIRPN